MLLDSTTGTDTGALLFGFAFWIVIAWVVPTILAHKMTIKRNRGNFGWVWGILLGWLGVLIIACLGYKDPPKSEAEIEVEKLELQVRLDELRDKQIARYARAHPPAPAVENPPGEVH